MEFKGLHNDTIYRPNRYCYVLIEVIKFYAIFGVYGWCAIPFLSIIINATGNNGV